MYYTNSEPQHKLWTWGDNGMPMVGSSLVTNVTLWKQDVDNGEAMHVMGKDI